MFKVVLTYLNGAQRVIVCQQRYFGPNVASFTTQEGLLHVPMMAISSALETPIDTSKENS